MRRVAPRVRCRPAPTGNYACLASAIAQVLTREFGRDDVACSITWAEPAGTGITRSYAGVRQLADEAARNPIYGRIHFTFDTTASFGACTRMADDVYDDTFGRR